MSEQDATAQGRADHLKNLADGYAYGYGFLDRLVGDFLDGSLSEQAFREMYAQLQADLKTARGGVR